MKLLLSLAAAGLLILFAEPANARAEPLPSPRTLPTTAEPPAALPFLPPPPLRISRYAVWQNYGVSRSGHFLPRVLDTPYGAYYAYDGSWFPWVANHPRQYMPYAAD